MNHSMLGAHLRKKREQLRASDRRFSLRQVAERVGIEPSYLSKVERGLPAPLSEGKIRELAADLGEDPDVLLGLAGKVSADLQKIIYERPALFAQIIRELSQFPDDALVRLVREVRDGNW